MGIVRSFAGQCRTDKAIGCHIFPNSKGNRQRNWCARGLRRVQPSLLLSSRLSSKDWRMRDRHTRYSQTRWRAPSQQLQYHMRQNHANLRTSNHSIFYSPRFLLHMSIPRQPPCHLETLSPVLEGLVCREKGRAEVLLGEMAEDLTSFRTGGRLSCSLAVGCEHLYHLAQCWFLLMLESPSALLCF